MKPRILFLIASTQVGGGPQVVLDLLSGLRRDFDFTVIAPADGPFFDRFREAGARVYDVPLRRLNPFLIFSILRIIRYEQPVIVHTHGKGAGIHGRIAAFISRIPVLHTMHGIHIGSYGFFPRTFYLFLERIFSFFTKRIVAVSESERIEALRLKLFSLSRSIVISNGVSFSRFDSLSTRTENRRLLGLRDSDFLITGVGRLVHQKNFKEFLRIFARIVRQAPNARACLVGDGDQRKELEILAQSLHIQNTVSFLGTRNDVPALLQASDLFLSTSLWEGMPLVILEAMTTGLPVFASDVIGSRDLVHNNETGLTYPLRDITTASRKLFELFQNSDLRARLGQAAQTFVRNKYSLDTMLQSYTQLYYDTIGAA